MQLLMIRMQRPILMTGFGVVVGDLPTFAVVLVLGRCIKHVFNYDLLDKFQVLKSVSSVIAVFQSIQT